MCGKEFLNEYGKNQVYCGSIIKKKGCAYKARATKWRRYRWNNKEKRLESGKDQNKKTRKSILERYKYTCQICGLKNRLESFMDMDHKDGNRFNNEESNLWILCPNCHRIKTIRDRKNNN